MAESMWVGKDEHEGVLAQPRKDVKPPPHWRLEAIAQHAAPALADRARPPGGLHRGRRPRPRTSGCSTSRPAAPPERLTTGREPVPYWEDTAPRLSPDGSTVAYADGEHVWLVADGRRPAAQAGRGRRPGVGRRRAARRRGRARRHDPPGGRRRRRRVAATPRGRARRARRARRRGRARRLARRRPRSPTPSPRAPTSTAQRDPRRRPRRRRGARADRHAAHARQQPGVVARRRRRSPTRPSAAASTSCTSPAPRSAS